jgi:DNA polymerase-3 subunit gamma/tau
LEPRLLRRLFVVARAGGTGSLVLDSDAVSLASSHSFRRFQLTEADTMASQSLYRKWRSQTFSDLVGQEATVRTLLNAVREGRLAHAYLFCGPRGTGKTSAARLLAKSINCANPRDGEPCNECVSCLEISAGHSPDVIEIDAASNTGVDNIRDLRENVNLLGSGGRYKVYIVDEAHMLSTQAFNALLKTLEEPPPHVIFVLATTEAHKVLPTVVSRCQRFDFRRFSMQALVDRLRYVAAGEGLTLEPGVAETLARAANGGMRDALSLLDQARAYCGDQIDAERLRTMLGLADPAALRGILEAIADQRAADALDALNDLVAAGADLRQLQQQLADEWRALLLARAGVDVIRVMERTEDEARTLNDLANRFSLDELTGCARVFARMESPARGLPTPQLALELLLLECLAVRRSRNGGVPVQAQPVQQRSPAPAAPQRVQSPAASQAPQTMPAPSPPAPVELDMEEVARATGEDDSQLAEVTRSALVTPPPAPRQSGPPAAPAPLEPQQNSAGASALLEVAQRRWADVRKVCKSRSPSVSGLLSSARPVSLESGAPPTIVLQVDFQFHLEQLRDPARRQTVEWALEQIVEEPVFVRFTLASDPGAPLPGGGAPLRREPPSGAPPHSNGNGASNGNGNGANGARHTSGKRSGEPPLMNLVHESPVSLSLEDEARADPVVQMLLRSGANLLDVRPIEGEASGDNLREP